jgi:hypothetical protein
MIEPIHIIHLTHRTDRMRNIQEQMEGQNIKEFRIWEGIIDKQYRPSGICRAHKQIVQYALHNQLPEITIVEDDICFTAPGAFEFYLQSEPASYDLYIGGLTWGEVRNGMVTDFAGTVLYRIRRHFYETFLNLPESGDFDRNLKGLGIYRVCEPMIAIQQDGYSDKRQEYFSCTPFLKGRKLFGRD